MRPIVTLRTVLCTSLVTLTALSGNAFAGDIDWEGIEQGAFDVNFTACTADSHVAHVHLKMTTYSPMDPVPAGYTQADKAEVAATSTEVFAYEYSPYIAKAADVAVTAESYLSDLGSEPKKIKDDQGQMVDANLITVAMDGVKQELMKKLKYSGLGVGYEESAVTVDASASCTPSK